MNNMKEYRTCPILKHAYWQQPLNKLGCDVPMHPSEYKCDGERCGMWNLCNNIIPDQQTEGESNGKKEKERDELGYPKG